MNQARCIYCSEPVDMSRGEGDHVIPAALGRFRNDLRFRRICRECNGRLGRLEETLLRSAPEAVFRRLVQPSVKRKKRGSGWAAASGGARPKFTIVHADHTELVDAPPDDPSSAEPIDQLVIVDTNKGEYHIVLHPAMTVEQLRARIEKLELTPSERSYLHADEANHDHYVGMLGDLWPESKYVEGEPVDAGMHQAQGRMEFKFSVDYYRALAKIAFHYCLVVSKRGLRGDEPEFEAIRVFIRDGGDHEPFFNTRGARFASPFRELPDGSAILSSVWGHLLAVDEEQSAAVVNLNLFLGPKRLPPSHHVTLARIESPIIVPGGQTAHAYTYYGKPDKDGFAGQVDQVTVARLR